MCNLILLNWSQDVIWGISHVIESLIGSGRNPFQSCCPCGCWLEASASYHTYFSQGLLECLHNTEGGFPQSERCKRESKEEATVSLMTQPGRSHCIISAASCGLPMSVLFRVGGATQGHGFQEAGIMGAMLETGCRETW